MKRYLTMLLMFIFIATNVMPVLADGIGNDQLSNYPDTEDYRDFPIGLTPTHERPLAGFALEIKGQAGEIMSGVWNSDREPISSTQDSPKITASIGDKIIISDRSSVGSGSHISQYDIQYRFVPKGERREDYALVSNYVNNFPSVKNIIENLPLNEEGTYEIYLCVADNAPVLPGATNWSANGNVRSINTSNPTFPEGMFWYFTSALVEVGGSPPDFYPTPEGESEWKESFLSNAKTYTGEVGEIVDVKVNLYNQGEKDVTNFGCTWYGSGWEEVVWGEPELEVEKGSPLSFTIPVAIPAHGEETRLVFRANVDGETPSTEVNLNNNTMVIIVRPEGEIDLALYTDKAVIEGPANTTQALTVMVHNLSEVPVTTKAGWIYFDNIEAGWTNISLGDIELEAGERKDFLLPVTVTDRARTLQVMVNYERNYPMEEVNYDNNAVNILVKPVNQSIAPPTGGQELNFQAWRQWSFLDVMGHDREYREPNTAKFTDIVETTLTPTKVKRVQTVVNKGDYIDYTNTIAPPVPTCGDSSCGAWNTMTGWKISKATLHYPKKSDNFTFGNPVWDHIADWTYMAMETQGKTARERFKEEWAMDGTPIHNVTTGLL